MKTKYAEGTIDRLRTKRLGVNDTTTKTKKLYFCKQ